MHAAAQYALAEQPTRSFLEDILPENKNNVFAVLRKTKTRYISLPESFDGLQIICFKSGIKPLRAVSKVYVTNLFKILKLNPMKIFNIRKFI